MNLSIIISWMSGINLIYHSKTNHIMLLESLIISLKSFTQLISFDTFELQNPVELSLLTRLWMCLSHLNGHKCKHKFWDFLNPLCACNLEQDTMSHYLLCCQLFHWNGEPSYTYEINEHILTDHINDLDQILLYRGIKNNILNTE